MNILEIGIEKGIGQGIEKGIKQGIDLGRAETLVKNVETIMKNWGMGLEEVCKGMGITAEEYYEAKKRQTN